MITKYYINVARVMGQLPRPRPKCTLHNDRAETLDELPIIKLSGIDGDYYETPH